LLSTSPTAVGSKSITFTDVTGTGSQSFYVQGLAQASTTLTAQAAGYDDRQTTVSVTPSGFHLSSGNAGSVNLGDFSITTLSANRTMSVHAYRLTDDGALQSRQELRAGLDPVEISVTSSDTAVGQITTSPVVFTTGQAWQLTEFEPLTAGTTTITMIHPE
jgi:hypothetical protein